MSLARLLVHVHLQQLLQRVVVRAQHDGVVRRVSHLREELTRARRILLGRLGVRLPPPMLEAARKQNAYPLGLVMLPQLVDSMQAKRQKEQSQPTP